MKLNQKGFGAIEGLLLVIAITLIVGVGFYIFNVNKDSKKPPSATTQNSQQPLKTKTTESKKQYLEIKELGIKFELTDKIKDAYYKKIDSNYYLSLHDFDNNPELSGCSIGSTTEGSSGLLAITQGRVGEDNGIPGGGTWSQAELDASGSKKIGDTYYGFMHGNAACWKTDGPNASKNESLVNGVIEAFIAQTSTITKI